MTSDTDMPATAHDVDGNRLCVVTGGPALRDALLLLIAGARVRLRLFYYIFADDESGRAVREALIDACNRGVDVTLMVDAFGSGTTGEAFFGPLRDAGGKFARFGTGWSTRYLIRNHQKMTIADDSRALIGGFNVADAYFSPQDDRDGWLDLGLEIAGPQVAHLGRWYGQLWRWTSGQGASFLRLRRLVRRWHPGRGTFAWLIGGPTRRLSPWARRVRTDLDTARRVDMVAAYFSPGRRMLLRLGEVVRRGGGTRLLLAARSDNGASVAASRTLYGGLVRRGVAIYEYLPRKLHMKLIVIDDAVYIGSANFDMRSLFLNLELMLRIEDARLAADMRGLIDRWSAQSLAITPDVLARRSGWWRKVRGWISYILVGVLDYTVTRRLNFPDDMPDEEP